MAIEPLTQSKFNDAQDSEIASMTNQLNSLRVAFAKKTEKYKLLYGSDPLIDLQLL